MKGMERGTMYEGVLGGWGVGWEVGRGEGRGQQDPLADVVQ